MLGPNARAIVECFERVLAGFIEGNRLGEEHKRKLYEEWEARNKMKIIAISEEMFEQFCDKLTPMQRGAGGIMAARCFYLYAQQALIVVAGDCTLGALEDMPVPTSLTQLGAAAKACETRPVTDVVNEKKASPWRQRPPLSAFTEETVKLFLRNMDEAQPGVGVGTDGLVESAKTGLYEKFTDKARRAVFFARYEAQQNGDREIENAHLLLGVLREDKNLFRQLRPGLDVTEIIRKHVKDNCMRRLVGFPEKTDDPMLDRACKIAIRYASVIADNWGSGVVGTEHLLGALVGGEDSKVNQILDHVGITGSAIMEYIVKRDAASAPPPETPDAIEGRVVVKELPNSIDVEIYVDGVLKIRSFNPSAPYKTDVDALRAVCVNALREKEGAERNAWSVRPPTGEERLPLRLWVRLIGHAEEISINCDLVTVEGQHLIAKSGKFSEAGRFLLSEVKHWGVVPA